MACGMQPMAREATCAGEVALTEPACGRPALSRPWAGKMIALKTAVVFVLAASCELSGTYAVWRWLRAGATPAARPCRRGGAVRYAGGADAAAGEPLGRVFAAYAGVLPDQRPAVGVAGRRRGSRPDWTASSGPAACGGHRGDALRAAAVRVARRRKPSARSLCRRDISSAGGGTPSSPACGCRPSARRAGPSTPRSRSPRSEPWCRRGGGTISPRRVAGTTRLPFSFIPWWARMMWPAGCPARPGSRGPRR